MEEIAGVSGALPPLVPYRTAAATNLPPQEWQACLDSWLVSIEARLRLADKQFSTLSLSDSGSGVPFLMSYFRRRPGSAPADLHQPMEVRLHQYSYLLTKRLLLGIPESNLLEQSAMLSFILEANANFNTVSEWRQTLGQSVFVQSPLFDSSLASWKALVGTALLSKPSSEWIEDLTRMNLLVKTLPRVGFELMKGADYLESLMHAFASSELPAAQTVVVENTYRSLLSLLSPEYTRPNSLMDQLHLLKSEASQSRTSQQQQQQQQKKKEKNKEKTLCSALICETSFLRHLAASTALNSTKRGRDTINNLTEYREQTKHLHPPPQRRKPKSNGNGKGNGKGKDRATGVGEIHIHRAASISQVHELFPDLSAAYIIRLLDYFQDNTESVIAALLEPDSLPPHLLQTSQDHNGETTATTTKTTTDETIPAALHSTPPLLPAQSHRRNVFDDDAFDKLQISARQVHRGRKAIDIISPPSTTEEHNRSKAAIMAALAAFDSDDDERDDTYDVADVGGTVDQSIDTDNRPNKNNNNTTAAAAANLPEELLFRAWKDTPALFARDSSTRISPARQQLKRELGGGMTDEQIEGWAIMLSKDQSRQRRLEKQYSLTLGLAGGGGGNQRVLAPTKWSASRAAADDEAASEENPGDEDGDNKSGAATPTNRSGGASASGSSRNRGGRGGRGGRGARGAAAHASSPPATTATTTTTTTATAPAQSNKKSEHARQHGGFRSGGRGGRNTRREGRAKKMARGAFGGPPDAA